MADHHPLFDPEKRVFRVRSATTCPAGDGYWGGCQLPDGPPNCIGPSDRECPLTKGSVTLTPDPYDLEEGMRLARGNCFNCYLNGTKHERTYILCCECGKNVCDKCATGEGYSNRLCPDCEKEDEEDDDADV